MRGCSAKTDSGEDALLKQTCERAYDALRGWTLERPHDVWKRI